VQGMDPPPGSSKRQFQPSDFSQIFPHHGTIIVAEQVNGPLYVEALAEFVVIAMSTAMSLKPCNS